LRRNKVEEDWSGRGSQGDIRLGAPTSTDLRSSCDFWCRTKLIAGFLPALGIYTGMASGRKLPCRATRSRLRHDVLNVDDPGIWVQNKRAIGHSLGCSNRLCMPLSRIGKLWSTCSCRRCGLFEEFVQRIFCAFRSSTGPERDFETLHRCCCFDRCACRSACVDTLVTGCWRMGTLLHVSRGDEAAIPDLFDDAA
jgi:hypothetical protein